MTDVKKATALTAATSLESSDSILAFDSTGKAKKITAEKFKETKVSGSVSGKGWVRILEMGTNGGAGIIMLQNPWYNSAPRPLLFAYAIPHGNWNTAERTTVTVLTGSTLIFQKARVVYADNKSGFPVYLEVWKAITDGSVIIDSVLGNVGKIVCSPGEVPEGYLAKELEWGGVNT